MEKSSTTDLENWSLLASFMVFRGASQPTSCKKKLPIILSYEFCELQLLARQGIPIGVIVAWASEEQQTTF